MTEMLIANGFCSSMYGNEKILDFNSYMTEYHKSIVEMEELEWLFDITKEELDEMYNHYENKELIEKLKK